MRVSAPRGLGSTPDRVIGLCSLTTHFTLTVSLYPGVEMGTGEEGGLMKCWGQPCDRLASYPGGGGILTVASYHENRDKHKLRLGGPHGPSMD